MTQQTLNVDRLCGVSPNCYTKALMDVLDAIESRGDSLKHYRCFNYKNIRALLAAFIEYREVLRKWGGHAVIVKLNEKAPRFILKDPEDQA
jgi:hypothetical protein